MKCIKNGKNISATTELPWRECNNEWNTETCRNPYEKPFNESCKLSDLKYPCSEVGAKYRDCEVGWLCVLGRDGVFISIFRKEQMKPRRCSVSLKTIRAILSISS